jgi:hypothetical protein
MAVVPPSTSLRASIEHWIARSNFPLTLVRSPFESRGEPRALHGVLVDISNASGLQLDPADVLGLNCPVAIWTGGASQLPLKWLPEILSGRVYPLFESKGPNRYASAVAWFEQMLLLPDLECIAEDILSTHAELEPARALVRAIVLNPWRVRRPRDFAIIDARRTNAKLIARAIGFQRVRGGCAAA